MDDDAIDTETTGTTAETRPNQRDEPRSVLGRAGNSLAFIQGATATTLAALVLAAGAAGLLAADPAAATDDHSETINVYVTNRTAGDHTNVTVVGVNPIDDFEYMGVEGISISLCRSMLSTSYKEKRECWTGYGWTNYGSHVPPEWIGFENTGPGDTTPKCEGEDALNTANFACWFNATLPGNATPENDYWELQTRVFAKHDVDLGTYLVDTRSFEVIPSTSTQGASATPVSGGVAAEVVAVGAFVMGALAYAAGRSHA